MSNSLAPSETMVLFSKRVNAMLEEQELSKSELARRASMPVASLRAILNRNAGSCSFATADRIASALGTTTAKILAG